MPENYHQPVLLEEVIDLLDLQKGDTVVDATYGFGGHSRKILSEIGRTGKIIGIEQDPDVFKISREALTDKRVKLINDNFSAISSILTSLKKKKIDKILFDLGISSYHYDSLKLGFSFHDPELDMRLNRQKGDSAKDLVNYLPEKELADLLYKNADEYLSRRIARAIVAARRQKKISSAHELSEIISKSVPRRGKVHPATKTFQALRIAVNNELEVLEETLPKAINLLNKDGRIAVISFHSLEDRIVKNIFKQLDSEGIISILIKKPVVAKREEILKNSRSRSAKLRVAKKN